MNWRTAIQRIDAAIQIKKSLPAAKLLFFTMHPNPAYLEAALSAGATGYVLKSAHGEALLVAIGRVLDGCIYVSPSLSNEHLERLNDPRLAAAILHLTLREWESLGLIAQGPTASNRLQVPEEGRAEEDAAEAILVPVAVDQRRRRSLSRQAVPTPCRL